MQLLHVPPSLCVCVCVLQCVRRPQNCVRGMLGPKAQAPLLDQRDIRSSRNWLQWSNSIWTRAPERMGSCEWRGCEYCPPSALACSYYQKVPAELPEMEHHQVYGLATPEDFTLPPHHPLWTEETYTAFQFSPDASEKYDTKVRPALLLSHLLPPPPTGCSQPGRHWSSSRARHCSRKGP